MPALGFLQEGPNTDLSWLLYVLLGFMVLVIAVGALAGPQKNGAASKSGQEAVESPSKRRLSVKTGKPPVKKKSK